MLIQSRRTTLTQDGAATMQTLPMTMTKSALCCLALLMGTPVFADADQTQPPACGDHAGPPHKPPTEAYTACKALAQDATCSVDFGEHHVDGKCSPDREDGTLFCRPDHPPAPPQAAFDACSDKSAGDGCSVTLGDHTLTGACASGPDGKLACRPSK
jgi:hypothetical protein